MATCPTCRERYGDDVSVCPTDGEALLPDEACQNFDADLQVGEMVGEYRVEAKIGEGGFGKVYRGVHPVIGKRAAIKVLNREYSSNPSVVSRFVSEARAVNQIRHRNIIDIFAFGTLDGGLQYFIMELLDGLTMDAYLEQNGRMTPEQAVPVLMGLARALDAAHASGIAHRDLKPENVFLSFDDEGTCFPKLLDFGIAKLMGDTTVGHKTRTGAAMGTPLYMSPEQCRGQGVDHRTDIYSFGVMTHEVLTGALPFDGQSMMDLMLKHTSAPPPPMSTVCPDVPAELDGPVLHMLAKEPGERPQSLVQAVTQLAEAARAVGFDVKTKSTTLGDGLRSPSRGDVGTSGAAATVAMGPGGPVLAKSAQSATQQTMESDVPRAGSGGGKTMVLVAAALVVGVGATVAFVSMRDSGEAAAGPAATQGTAPALPSASSAPTESAATTSAAAEAAPSASVAPSASAVVAPPPTVAGPTATAPSTATRPPPTQTATKPVVPDDLASPF